MRTHDRWVERDAELPLLQPTGDQCPRPELLSQMLRGEAEKADNLYLCTQMTPMGSKRSCYE